jgi:hypothetical protein
MELMTSNPPTITNRIEMQVSMMIPTAIRGEWLRRRCTKINQVIVRVQKV